MTRKKTKKMLEADRVLIEADNAKVAAERAELIVNSPVFEQPKGDTPLARAMSIPWVAAGIKPEVHGEEGDSYKQSRKLLLWVPNFGGCTGLFVTNNGSSKFLVNGFVGGTAEVTHWAYVTEPK